MNAPTPEEIEAAEWLVSPLIETGTEYERQPLLPEIALRVRQLREEWATCDGWSTDRLEWLECSCGLRTTARDITYNRDQHEAEMIAIFKGKSGRAPKEA
jgi:hypothetical protein